MAEDDNQQKSIIKLFHDGKSGLEGLDSEKINRIINDTTRGSNFYVHKLKKEQKIEQRVKIMKQRLENSTFVERDDARRMVEKLKAEYREIGKDLSHLIVHIDMDMFFVAVEIRDNPTLKDKPCAVGSQSMISTSNYVARKFGVRAGMPGFIGLKLCPQLELIPGRYHAYKQESVKITSVMLEYDETFVPCSLDECSIDLTSYLVKKCSLPDSKVKFEIKKPENGELVLDDDVWNLAEEVVQEIRQKVFERTQLTCSAGIAPNKMLAKMCSDINKPNNQYMLKGTSQNDIIKFIQSFNVKKIPGIGPVQQLTLKGFDIETVEQLHNNLETLCLVTSQLQIEYFTRVSLGVSSFEMHTSEDLERKSESREETFNANSDPEFLLKTLKELCDCLCSSLVRHQLKGKTITLKYKTDKFEVRTRSKTINNYVDDSESVFEVGKKLLLKEMEGSDLKLRLIGMRVSNFMDENEEKNQQAKIDDLFKRKQDTLNGNQMSICETNINRMSICEATSSNASSEINTSDEIDGKSAGNELNEDNVNDRKEDELQNSFLCPVCSISRFSSLNDLNQHIDYCLSRETIMSSVREFNDNQLVIPSASLDDQASNKRKLTNLKDNAPNKKKITEYFKKQ